MQKLNTRERRTYIIVALLIAVAIACRIMGKMDCAPLFLAYIRAAIYLFLFSAWAVSLKRRIVQPQARRLMVSIAILMVVWLLTRTIKYNIYCVPAERWLWYFFYLAMLFIPLLSAYVAFSLGKPDHFRLSKRPLVFSCAVTLALFLLVMTNDLHQLVFTFPPEYPDWTAYHYGYGTGYYFVVAWMLTCAFTALVVMIKKCRVPHSRTVLFLPFIPMLCTLVYAVLYCLHFPLLYFLMGDITVAFCLLFAAILESGIQCGLIQVNTHYDELFRASSITAQITDEEYNTFISSDVEVSIPKETMRKAAASPVLLSGGIRLMSAPIAGGHVLWQEDMSPLLAAQAELQKANEALAQKNELLRQKYKEEKLRLRVEEANRLYDAMERDTEKQTRLMTDQLQKLPEIKDEEQMRRMLCSIAVIGAYLKRRNNLIFVASQQESISANELASCLNESARGIMLGGRRCRIQCELRQPLPPRCAMLLYDFFEDVVESAGAEASFYVTVTEEGGVYTIAVSTVSAAGLHALSEKYPSARVHQDDDDTWSLALTVPREVNAE